MAVSIQPDWIRRLFMPLDEEGLLTLSVQDTNLGGGVVGLEAVRGGGVEDQGSVVVGYAGLTARG